MLLAYNPINQVKFEHMSASVKLELILHHIWYVWGNTTNSDVSPASRNTQVVYSEATQPMGTQQHTHSKSGLSFPDTNTRIRFTHMSNENTDCHTSM